MTPEEKLATAVVIFAILVSAGVLISLYVKSR